MQSLAVSGQGVTACGEARLGFLAARVAQRREDTGGCGLGEVGRNDFEDQFPDRVRTGGQVVDDAAEFGESGLPPAYWWAAEAGRHDATNSAGAGPGRAPGLGLASETANVRLTVSRSPHS